MEASQGHELPGEAQLPQVLAERVHLRVRHPACPRLSRLGCAVHCLGCGVYLFVVGCRVSRVGCGVCDLSSRVWGFGAWGFGGLGVSGVGFGVWDLGCRGLDFSVLVSSV